MNESGPIRLEIVSHCWRYSRLLTYQLSSLLLNPVQRAHVTMTIFCTEEDDATDAVLRFFEPRSLPGSVQIRQWRLPLRELTQRAIGRNLAALATDADWIWFTDCDYVFGEGSLDSLQRSTQQTDADLVYPGTIYASRTQELGDQAIVSASGEPRIIAVQSEDFSLQQFNRAIGGVQIVRGDVARQIGYCKGRSILKKRRTKWQMSSGDVQFRRIIGSRGTQITIPNLYRIRHSTRGYRQAEVSL